jgi:hypothetical protein
MSEVSDDELTLGLYLFVLLTAECSTDVPTDDETEAMRLLYANLWDLYE